MLELSFKLLVFGAYIYVATGVVFWIFMRKELTLKKIYKESFIFISVPTVFIILLVNVLNILWPLY